MADEVFDKNDVAGVVGERNSPVGVLVAGGSGLVLDARAPHRVDECDAEQDRRAAGDQPVQRFDGGPVDELGVVEKQSAVDGEFQDGVAVAGIAGPFGFLPVSSRPSAERSAMWSPAR